MVTTSSQSSCEMIRQRLVKDLEMAEKECIAIEREKERTNIEYEMERAKRGWIKEDELKEKLREIRNGTEERIMKVEERQREWKLECRRDDNERKERAERERLTKLSGDRLEGGCMKVSQRRSHWSGRRNEDRPTANGFNKEPLPKTNGAPIPITPPLHEEPIKKLRLLREKPVTMLSAEDVAAKEDAAKDAAAEESAIEKAAVEVTAKEAAAKEVAAEEFSEKDAADERVAAQEVSNEVAEKDEGKVVEEVAERVAKEVAVKDAEKVVKVVEETVKGETEERSIGHPSACNREDVVEKCVEMPLLNAELLAIAGRCYHLCGGEIFAIHPFELNFKLLSVEALLYTQSHGTVPVVSDYKVIHMKSVGEPPPAAFIV